jgi:crossover junction endodeoxyribonuclease RusA
MIELPFPPAVLSPNARPHWAQKARAFKSYKAQCHALLSQHRDSIKGRDSFELRFHPPTAHRFDLDNLVSRVKAAIDALALVTGVDDSKFQLTIAKGEPRKGGAVIVRPA